jgi:uncharacterized protein YoxC
MKEGGRHMKVIWKNWAVAMGILCGVLLSAVVGVTAFYVPLTSRLNENLSMKDNTINSLNETVNDQKLTIDNQNSQISGLNTEVADLKNQTNSLNNTVNDQKRTIENQSSQIANLTLILHDLNSSYSQLQANYTNYSASHTHNDSDFNLLNATLKSLQINYTNLYTAFINLNNDYYNLTNSQNPVNITFGANNTYLNSSEVQTFTSIINRIIVYDPSPSYNGARTLQWVSMRNSSSAPWDNISQKAMEFLLFQPGQGANGEWQAVLSIYNSPNSTNDYVVEVSRFTWHEIQVKLGGNIMVDFPEVTSDVATLSSLGYATFHVNV